VMVWLFVPEQQVIEEINEDDERIERWI
jgi:hypothetical protein